VPESWRPKERVVGVREGVRKVGRVSSCKASWTGRRSLGFMLSVMGSHCGVFKQGLTSFNLYLYLYQIILTFVYKEGGESREWSPRRQE